MAQTEFVCDPDVHFSAAYSWILRQTQNQVGLGLQLDMDVFASLLHFLSGLYYIPYGYMHVGHVLIFLSLVLSHPRLKVVDAYDSSSCGARLPFLKLIQFC
jgi:hypothetical protein